MTTKTLGELAQLLQAECIGNAAQEIRQVVHPAQANGPDDIALILDEAVLPLLSQKAIQTALVPEGMAISNIPNQIQVKRPKVALAKLLDVFERPVHTPPGIHPSTVIDPTATIESGVSIGPLCSVGPGSVIGKGSRLVSHVSIGADVTIGENSLFHAGVVIGDRVQIGSRVIIQPNASIGNDGYSYVTPEAGSVESARSSGQVNAQNTAIIRINSIGTVVLEDEVEVGANTCIDRATLGETRVKHGTKIDNLVQVGHNVTIGENCLIVSQVGLAGSIKVGNRVVIAGQAGIKDHTTIEDDVIIMPQSGVSHDVKAKSIIFGSPAIPRRDFLYREMQLKRLKGLFEKVESLSKELSEMQPQEMEEAEQGI